MTSKEGRETERRDFDRRGRRGGDQRGRERSRAEEVKMEIGRIDGRGKDGERERRSRFAKRML